MGTAVDLWQKAIDLGETEAMCALAVIYLDHRFLGERKEEGLAILRGAAERKNEWAQWFLGSLLVKDQDPALEAEGLHWIRVAADNRSATAHRLHGAYYRLGEHGLPVDASASRAHFKEADRLEESPEA